MKFALSFRGLYVVQQMVYFLFCTGVEHVSVMHALNLGHLYIVQNMIFLELCTEFWTLVCYAAHDIPSVMYWNFEFSVYSVCCCRPQKGKPYVMNLIPCIIHIARRTEESVLETLAAAMPKIFKALGNFTSDNDVKVCRNYMYSCCAFTFSNDITRWFFTPSPPLHPF